MAEGAPLLREYVVMSCIKGSNPFVSANPLKPQNIESNQRLRILGLFSFPTFLSHLCQGIVGTDHLKVEPRGDLLSSKTFYVRLPVFDQGEC